MATTPNTDDYPPFLPEGGSPAGAGADAIMRIPVALKIVLGSAVMPVAKLLKLGRGAVIPLDRAVGEAVDVVVNGHVIARGEIVILDDNGERFGISLTEIVGGGGLTKG